MTCKESKVTHDFYCKKNVIQLKNKHFSKKCFGQVKYYLFLTNCATQIEININID